MTRFLTVIFCLLYFTNVVAKIKVATFLPRHKADMFFSLVAKFMDAAAKDLDIEVTHYHYGEDFSKLVDLSSKIMDTNVDFIMLPNYKGTINKILFMANEKKKKVFVFNAHTIDLGKPREKYKYWIGEMYPDDMAGGERLAVLLNERAKQLFGSPAFIGIEGFVKSPASMDRKAGLLKAINKLSINSYQITNADWKPEVAKEKFNIIKTKRFPAINTIWAASDGMALGVIKGGKELGLIPGKDFITGGFDITAQGLNAIKMGEMEYSLGAHFTEGAWALVLIHDYFHGKDFASEKLIFKTKLYLASKKTVSKFEKLLNSQNWDKIDFTKYSKFLNPEIKKYDFSMEKLFEQL